MKFTLPLPPRTNTYWRSIVIGGRVRVLLSSEARRYKANMHALWHAQTPRLDKLTGPLSVSVRVFRERRAGDVDGRIKPLLDVLQGLAYENDSQIVELHAFNDHDKHSPRIEVEVLPIGVAAC